MRVESASTILLGVVLFIAGLLLISGIIAWLVKMLGFVLMVVGIVVVIWGLLGRRPRRRSY